MPRANTIRPYANLTIGFLAQNAAIGLTFGCFGLLIDPVAREFGGSRSLLSFSIGMISLVFGLLGPMTGALLDRWYDAPLRRRLSAALLRPRDRRIAEPAMSLP